MDMENSEHFVLHRNNGRLKSSPDFRRMIAYLTKPCTFKDSEYHCYYLVQYKFDAEEHKLPSHPHGNAKCTRPYRATQFSTRLAIKDSKLSSKPLEVVADLRRERGGFLMASSSPEMPRNAKQVSNLRSAVRSESLFRSSDVKDSLMLVMEKCKNSQKPFVRDVTAGPEPTCILTMDQQLVDLGRFCTSLRPSNSILGIDPTFSLGNFFVTCTVYRHAGVANVKTGKALLCYGPMFIHQQKQYSTYHKFAAGLLRLVPKLKHLKAFGTDGETNLFSAFSDLFSEAHHLRCFVHLQRNIKDKLSCLAISKEAVNQYLLDIFGKEVGGVYHGGSVI